MQNGALADAPRFVNVVFTARLLSSCTGPVAMPSTGTVRLRGAKRERARTCPSRLHRPGAPPRLQLGSAYACPYQPASPHPPPRSGRHSPQSHVTSRNPIDPPGCHAKGTEVRGHAALVKASENLASPLANASETLARHLVNASGNQHSSPGKKELARGPGSVGWPGL